MPRTIRVDASVDVIRWGAFDASFPAVAEIDSGDTVVLECLSGAPEVMPPRESNRQLKPAEIELLKKWIAEGANWGTHWAFSPPQRPNRAASVAVRSSSSRRLSS